jgi:heme/copper-type cytochrome/quinol oxidase subunit 3
MGLARPQSLASSSPSRSYPRLVRSGGKPPGAGRPRSEDNAVLGVVLFLGTEIMLFAGLVSAYLILRAGSTAWPPLGQPRLPIAITAANTLVLLASVYTMWKATAAARGERRADVPRWLGLTALLGAVFLLVQGIEWVRLVRFGLSAAASLYGATFYTVIGCHGLHVLAAVFTLCVVLSRIVRDPGTGSRSTLQACQAYWLFVVGIWPILYVLVYLA